MVNIIEDAHEVCVNVATRQKTNYLETQRSKGSMNKGHSVLYLISIWSCVEI
jgi:hypothetical protein